MVRMYLFRGVSATGKTTLTNRLGELYHIPVFRKDNIYDSIVSDMTHGDKTRICYDALVGMIQTNLDLGIDVMVDIALPHRAYIDLFLGKLDLGNCELIPFFCICSDHATWKSRWVERMKNPAPNQLFVDIDEVDEYYNQFDFTLLENEITIDSMDCVESILSGLERFFR